MHYVHKQVSGNNLSVQWQVNRQRKYMQWNAIQQLGKWKFSFQDNMDRIGGAFSMCPTQVSGCQQSEKQGLTQRFRFQCKSES